MPSNLAAIRVANFKAVADSKKLELTPLTVFIGNNGSGKSSIIEALQTLQRIVVVGIDGAMQAFKGMEHVKHKAVVRSSRASGPKKSIQFHALQFSLWGDVELPSAETVRFEAETMLNADGGFDNYFVSDDIVTFLRDRRIEAKRDSESLADAPVLRERLGPFIKKWQFLNIDPSRMGDPLPTRRTSGSFLLDSTGSNLSDYLWHLVNDYEEAGKDAWDGIVEALRFVLPYAGDMRPSMTTELERRSSVFLHERFGKGGRQGFDVPAWMLSTGTMRVLALLAVLRHPEPPPLICIEEIENGLDPRTIRLIVNEIQTLVESEQSQVILTTHSPHLLDLLPLSSIVMTQRTEDGVTFTRPAGSEHVREWAEDFSPGQLYMMGRFDGQSEA